MTLCPPLNLALIQLTYKGNKFENLDTKMQESIEWITCQQVVIKGKVVNTVQFRLTYFCYCPQAIVGLSVITSFFLKAIIRLKQRKCY